MSHYEYKETEHGDAMECSLCGSFAPLIESGRLPAANRGEKHHVCEVCHTTHCGTVQDYGHTYDLSEVRAARMIAQCTNLILRKLPRGSAE